MKTLRGLRRCGGPLVALTVLAVPLAAAGAQEAPQLRSALLPAEGDPIASTQSQTDIAGTTQSPVDPATGNNVVATQQAQESRLTVGPETPVETRPRPRRNAAEDRNAPFGLRAGAFRIYPAIGVGGVYTDNVSETRSARQGDIGLRLTPDLRIESDWVRHALTITAAGDFVFYDKHPEFNDTTFDASSDLRLDVRHNTTLDLRSGYSVSQTFGSSSEVPANASTQRVDQTASASVSLKRNLGRIAATLTGGADWYVYGNVKLTSGIENNRDRDYVQPGAALRLGYAASPVLTPFVEAAYQPRLHELKYDRNGLRRDSEGGYVKAGLALDPSEIWRGELALRYDFRDYADKSLGSVSTIGLDADVTWRPTRLTTVTFSASTGLDETADINATSIRNWTGKIDIAHQLRDDVVLTGGVGANYASYVGIALNELTLTANAAVRYIVRRNVELTAGYSLTDFRSDNAGSNYVENRISAGIRLRM